MTNAQLWQQILPLASGAAVSPVLLLGQMALLTALGDRAQVLRRSFAYLVGAFIVVQAWSLAGGWIAHRLPLRQPGADPVAAAVQSVLALALLALAFQTLLRPASPPRLKRPLQQGLLAPLAQGMALMAMNVTSLVLYLPAVQELGRSGLPLHDRLLAWIGLDGITLVVVWVPPLLVLLSGSASSRGLERVGLWVQDHRRAIDASVAAGFGLFLALRALGEL